jgi:hypothetical protein
MRPLPHSENLWVQINGETDGDASGWPQGRSVVRFVSLVRLGFARRRCAAAPGVVRFACPLWQHVRRREFCERGQQVLQLGHTARPIEGRLLRLIRCLPRTAGYKRNFTEWKLGAALVRPL